MCHIRRDALTADNERHEEWFPLREAKDAMAEIKVDADLQENDEDGSTQFLLKIVCARNLRRISTNAISIGGGSSTTSTFANLSLKSASSDNALELLTSGLGIRLIARGMGSGRSMPRPSATADAKLSETLRSEETMRSRIAGTVTLLSSNRNPPMIWACSCGV